jgi:hypothetical protein
VCGTCYATQTAAYLQWGREGGGGSHTPATVQSLVCVAAYAGRGQPVGMLNTRSPLCPFVLSAPATGLDPPPR